MQARVKKILLMLLPYTRGHTGRECNIIKIDTILVQKRDAMHLSDFEYDQSSKIYMPSLIEKAAKDSFGYSDGAEIEKYILRSLEKSEDVKYDSEVLFRFIKDWPSYYHLGPGRANILRALDISRNSKVLEFGCGCGAVTRYLGEQFNSVDALEGSFLRTRIARERCRDLENVQLFNCNMDKVKFRPAYDVVTLIGVLEYAPKFFGKFPEEACLFCFWLTCQKAK